MPIVKLKDNNQMRISLKYITPHESPGRNGGGMEYMYTLSTGSQIYVSAQGHAEIQSLKLGPGEPFILAKLVDSTGAVTWAVERIPQFLEQPAPKPVSAARSISTAAGIPIPPSLTTPESQRMFRQLVATIEAVKAAEEFADSIGYPLKFSETSIRSMAISNSIAAQGQSRRAA